jgi:hypothetical protein
MTVSYLQKWKLYVCDYGNNNNNNNGSVKGKAKKFALYKLVLKYFLVLIQI